MQRTLSFFILLLFVLNFRSQATMPLIFSRSWILRAWSVQSMVFFSLNVIYTIALALTWMIVRKEDLANCQWYVVRSAIERAVRTISSGFGCRGSTAAIASTPVLTRITRKSILFESIGPIRCLNSHSKCTLVCRTIGIMQDWLAFSRSEVYTFSYRTRPTTRTIWLPRRLCLILALVPRSAWIVRSTHNSTSGRTSTASAQSMRTRR